MNVIICGLFSLGPSCLFQSSPLRASRLKKKVYDVFIIMVPYTSLSMPGRTLKNYFAVTRSGTPNSAIVSPTVSSHRQVPCCLDSHLSLLHKGHQSANRCSLPCRPPCQSILGSCDPIFCIRLDVPNHSTRQEIFRCISRGFI